MDSRINNFEKMLSDIQSKYKSISAELDKLKADGKTKSTTFKQLLTNKMMYKNILIIYKNYNLIDEYE